MRLATCFRPLDFFFFSTESPPPPPLLPPLPPSSNEKDVVTPVVLLPDFFFNGENVKSSSSSSNTDVLANLITFGALSALLPPAGFGLISDSFKVADGFKLIVDDLVVVLIPAVMVFDVVVDDEGEENEVVVAVVREGVNEGAEGRSKNSSSISSRSSSKSSRPLIPADDTGIVVDDDCELNFPELTPAIRSNRASSMSLAEWPSIGSWVLRCS